jgi:hypothetical protein
MRSGLVQQVESSIKADIWTAANHAYAMVGQKLRISPYDVHRLDQSFTINALMNVELSRKWGTHIVIGHFATSEHCFVGVSFVREAESRIYGDATWQRFVPDAAEDSNQLPRVLMGTGDEMAAQALEYGFTPQQAALWNPNA